MKNISREKAEEIFSLYANYVFKTIFMLTGSQSQADDITQETFIKVFSHFHQYDQSKPIKPWIAKIALNTLRAEKRKLKWLVFTPDLPEPSHENSLIENDLIKQENEKQLLGIINTLPIKQRQVVILHYFNDFSLQEISEILSIPLGTCKSRLHYAMKKLAKVTKDNSQFVRRIEL